MSNALATNKASESSLTQTDIRLKYLFECGVDFKNRSITIDGEIDSGIFTWFDAAMSELEAGSRKTITIKINSPGGSVYDALAIVGRLKSSKCMVITQGFGEIMSAAVLILAAGDKRQISKYAWIMVHESSYQADGRHSTFKDVVSQAEREQNQWAIAMEEFTGNGRSVWHDLIHRKETYLNAEQGIAYSIVDEVL